MPLEFTDEMLATFDAGVGDAFAMFGLVGASVALSLVVLRRPQSDFTFAAVANESTNFITPTSTFAHSAIKELFPGQFVDQRGSV